MDVAVDCRKQDDDPASGTDSGDRHRPSRHEVRRAHLHLQLDDREETNGSTEQEEAQLTDWDSRRGGMQVGWRIAIVCAVAFCINCQPSEPYLTQYLQEEKNLTETQLDTVVWPAELYANLAFLLPVGFAAEQLGYVPIIFFGLICREATRAVLIFSRSLGMMVLTQVTYAIASVANSVLLSYLYLVIPPSAFVTASLLFKACYTGGNVVGSALGQLLHDHTDISLNGLFYASWAFTSAGLLIFTFARPRQLPHSLEPHASNDPSDASTLPLNRSWSKRRAQSRQSYADGSRAGSHLQQPLGPSQHAGEGHARERTRHTQEPLVLIMDYSDKSKEGIHARPRTRERGDEPHPHHDHKGDADKADVKRVGAELGDVQGETEKAAAEAEEERRREEEMPLLSHYNDEGGSETWEQMEGSANGGRGVAQVNGAGTALWLWIRHRVWRYRQLYTHRLVLLWSLWWLFAFGSNVLFGNYYQTLLYNHYDHVPFGWIECGIEVGGTIGNLGQLGAAHHYVHSHLSPPVAAVCLVAAAALSQVLWPRLAVTATVYCLFSAVFKGTLGLASAGIAAHMTEQRFALVFTTNSFFSLALTTAISATASALHVDTLGYFRIVMGMSTVGLVAITAQTMCFNNRCSQGSR